MEKADLFLQHSKHLTNGRDASGDTGLDDLAFEVSKIMEPSAEDRKEHCVFWRPRLEHQPGQALGAREGRESTSNKNMEAKKGKILNVHLTRPIAECGRLLCEVWPKILRLSLAVATALL